MIGRTRSSPLWRIWARPELAAVVGAFAIFLFFSAIAGDRGFLSDQGAINYLEVSAHLGIIAVFVTLLMIAGEFDLSIGSMLGAAGIVLALAMTELEWPLWAALALSFSSAAAVGLANGYLVIKTALPSFIVTLAGLFILRGATIGGTAEVTDGATSVSGFSEQVADDPLTKVFAGEIAGIPISVFWWIALTAVAALVLAKTRFGNWVYAAGGDATAARKLGVPVARVKVILFVLTALGASFVAAISVLENNAADVLQGQLREFQAITAAVIGGTLLTGGYGTVVGTAVGALIFGMVSQGLFFTDANAEWFQAFVGGLLLAAVLINRYVRRHVEGSR
jgi:simple sugar transport system permease protein